MIVRRNFIREKAFDARNSRYKEVELFEYSEEDQEAVRQRRKTRTRASPPKIKSLNDSNSRKHFRWLFSTTSVREIIISFLHMMMNICEEAYQIVNVSFPIT